MQDVEWLKIKEIFHQTLDLPKKERESFLVNQADFVRSEVSRLLESHEKIDDFISEPVALEIGLDTSSYIGKTIGNYKIVSLLGSGGMGQVFLAEKEGLVKKFALKIIKRGMDTDSILKRFVRERQILSRLEHRYVASLIDAGSTENDLPFIVMEYVDGLTITKFCDEHQFDTKKRLEIFQKVCEAVKYAHQNLIIHRDLKPSNILVTADGTPKLLDFGIAKLLDSDDFDGTTTAMQPRMLTPEYASPEQISGQTITTATDVYSLGVVLYELLSGVRPFQSERRSYQEIANLVLTQEPVRPSSVVGSRSPIGGKLTSENEEPRTKREGPRTRSLKGDLENIILKSLRKEPERRYQSVQELSEDIRRFSVGLAVSATADSKIYHFKKFISRNRIGTAVAALFMFVSGISIWQGTVAIGERAKAEQRFNEVRKLANNVIFEYQDRINNLAGSTEIREKMVKDSAEYLEKLAVENSSDPNLQIELARAYDRLGDIKAKLSTSSRGNAAAAKEFYEKALEIKERMRIENLENPDYLEQIAVSYDKLGDVEFGLGNQRATLEYYQKAADLREQILQKMPENQEIRFRLMKGYRNIAVRGRNTENTEEQMILCRQALTMSEEFLRKSPENVDYLEGYGDVLEGIAAISETSPTRRTEAIEAYQRLIETRGQHSAKYPNNVVLRQKFGMAYSYLADTFFELGSLPKALENYRQSLEILEPLCQQDPLNEPLVQDSANIRSSYAYSLAVMGNTAESFESFTKIIPIFEEKYAKDKTDQTTHFRIAMAKEGFAITYDKLANLPELSRSEKVNYLKRAVAYYEESLGIYKVYQNADGAFPAINVNVNQAVSEVSEALRKSAETLNDLEKN